GLRARLAIADPLSVHPHERDDAADGAGEEDLVGVEEIARPEDRLLGGGLELQYDRARDPGQDPAAEGRRANRAVADEKEVARRGLGEMALGVQEEGLVVTRIPGFEEAQDPFRIAEE